VHDALIARVRDAGHAFRRVRECGGGDPRDVLMAVANGNGVALAPAPLLDTAGEIATIVTPCRTDRRCGCRQPCSPGAPRRM
jgi:hypothetical protein